MKLGKLTRAATFSEPQIDTEARTMTFPFSSEYPVERFFGTEVLSHDNGAADLTRLNDGAPLLFNHNMDEYVGVIEKAWIDAGRGYAKVKFSKNERAQQVLQDVQDGILRNVSFGYRIDEMAERGDTFTATRWTPYEVSLVTVPADPTVGVGRSDDGEESEVTVVGSEPETDDAPPAAADPVNEDKETEMETPDVSVIRAEAAEAERARIAGIYALTEKHNMRDLGDELVRGGRSIDEARAVVLERIGSKQQPVAANAGEIGLSDKEVRSFSFQRAINALANPGDRRAWEAAAFEREVSEAAQQRIGRSAQGILVPDDVLRRDLTVGSATSAGDLVGVDFRPGSFIELLRNRSALSTVGITQLTGLTGNVAIPRQTGPATAFWVSEGGSPTESQQTVDQVNLSPKTLGAFTDYSRKLMLQSSIDIETMIRSDLATVLALEIDRAALYGLGNQNQPLGLKFVTGINTKDFAADTPTYAEVIDMESLIAADNADIGSMVYIMNATMRGGLKSKDKGTDTGNYVWEPGNTVNGYPTVVSNQIASGDIFFGVWSQHILGLWSGLDLTVDPYTHSTSGTIRVVALQDVDTAVRHPESFCRGNNTL